MLALAAGLVVGAGVVGGVWWANAGQPDALPTPVPLSLSALPDEVLGQQRNDLALKDLGDDKATAERHAAEQAALFTEQSAAYRKAYGGPGIMANYGVANNRQQYQLLAVNGIQPAQPVTPDAVLASLGYLGSADAVAAPGTSTTQCTASPGPQGVPIDDQTGIDRARRAVLNDPESIVICVRSDRVRNFSVQVRNWVTDSDGGPSASDRARAMAAEVDKIWDSLIHQ